MKAFFDGAAVADDAPIFSARSRAVRFGDGVFETLRAYDGRPFALGEHLARLGRSAEWARLALPSESSVASEITRAAQSVDGDAAVRVFLSRGEDAERTASGVAGAARSLREAPTHRLVTAEPIAFGRELRSGSAILATGQATQPGHAGMKYMRYLPHLLAQDDARARGAEEALVCDRDGRIVEGATSNVFVVTAGALVTPAESSGILAGVTRGFVLRLAAEAGITTVQRPIEPTELERASELFITSSLREIFAVVRVGDRVIGDGASGPITKRLHVSYRALTIA